MRFWKTISCEEQDIYIIDAVLRLFKDAVPSFDQDMDWGFNDERDIDPEEDVNELCPCCGNGTNPKIFGPCVVCNTTTHMQHDDGVCHECRVPDKLKP